MDKKEKESIQTKEESLVDVFKKAFFTGVGAIFMTEEAIRNTLSEMSLPQEAIKMIMKNAQKGKEEVMEMMGREIRKVMEKVDIPSEFKKFLEDHTVSIEIKFKKK